MTYSAAAPCSNHLPVLRRRLRRVGQAGRQGRREIAGDAAHPSNFGRLCSKGSALGETLGLETRLLHPMIGTKQASWNEAIDHVAAEFNRVRDMHGPGSIAFYLSGQLLTEDYYVANKLAKGFIGTPHVDTNSRLCMASTVAGQRRAFGADVVPQSYEDLDTADLVILAGSNAAWCHPILYQRLQVARAERGTRVVTIDPRRTATAEGSDLHLAIRPGTDFAVVERTSRLAGRSWRARLALRRRAHAGPGACAWPRARDHAGSIASAAIAYRPQRHRHREILRRGGARRTGVVSCTSQGVNQSAQGTDKVNAIINCHLAAGRIGREGCGPLSLTGQPNAMGGREVGGLANMLAAHMGFDEADRNCVRRFWQAPNLVTGEGFKAVQMFDAIARGEIKALWVMGTNPAVSLPRADAVRDAMRGLELLVVSENVAAGDTASLAHVLLPAHAWGEKNGTVTNSERRISRQRAFLSPAGEAQADWWALSQVAQRFGWGEAFGYHSAADVFREHAKLSGFENNGTRIFDIGGLAGISDEEFEAFEPFQWPVREKGAGTARLFADGGFFTPPTGAPTLCRLGPHGWPTSRPGHGRSFSIPDASAISGTR